MAATNSKIPDNFPKPANGLIFKIVEIVKFENQK